MASDGEDLGASHPHVHGFPSSTDHAISSYGGDLGGSSSPVHGFQLYPLAELVAATDNFSLQNMIGAGSIGVVYRAELVAGGEVAIKRVEVSWSKRKELHEIVRGYLLTFLSRLHHKHLVELVGFCAEKDKRLFVFEYMKNGALYDHLHCKGSRVLNSWKRRIKVAFDASRGIQYLHNYAVPCIIHGDIKSSNILLDATWTARVSDFGLSFMKKTAGTVGYIDPEYLAGHAVTAKSDVYGFGVVLLELLTGKTAIFKSGDDGGSVVDFAVPHILSGEWVKILDPRIGPPDENEADAVELVAYTALHCVKLEGKDRPTIVEVVVNLESALASCCHSSHARISSATIPVVSQ